MRLSFFFIAALFLALPASAQKKKTASGGKKPAVVQPTLSAEEINFNNLLSATANVVFIDSIVVDQKDMYRNIYLSKSCGTIVQEQKDSLSDYICSNELNTLRYLSQADANGVHHLFKQTRIGREWSEPEKMNIEGNYHDIICPMLMPDGITLYFAAKGGDDALGGYDVLYTIYDSGSNTFLRPQSLGLPYNSHSDDLCCMIDDFSGIGYLATNRRQEAGKVCIYAFIASDSRETFDYSSLSETQLRNFARIHSIKDTQASAEKVETARQNLQNLKNGITKPTDNIHFIVNANIVYRSLDDFKSASNRERYVNYVLRNNEFKRNYSALEELRAEYHNGNHRKANQILEMEVYLQKERKSLEALEKQIRNAELLK